MIAFQESWPITGDLPGLRRAVHRYAAAAGLAGQRLERVVLAAHEALANVVEHGGGTGTLLLTRTGSDLVIDVTDVRGALSAAHLPDRPPPRPERPDEGMGLWLIGRLVDAATVDQRPGCSRIRLRIRLPATHPAG
ncbi:hypothetical protein Ppa06_70220 [Planomonospora parontospora subsp. parontospora]|uniref:Histidine kinase/HSP90-like ATPase domain-containing protein n=2 Tax=Planomonospora parontospora TaxID=58119 RepID=A0AA37F8G3_9ACTN|nr:ATP-binding protein [Planomonospora parontospora]GGL01454.1 hypothetical protein GCM10010126_70870 [Planomonospora parontospora]GII13224.1 hypothetical protein Ppa06_70220 [Planomonospora parontospora subsp. parontospora]